MAMKVTVGEKDENNVVGLSLITEAGRAREAYDKTLRRLGANLNIKGFRKGKAPLKVIEEHVGSDYVRAETMDNRFISDLFDEAFEESKLNVIHIGNIERVKFENPDDEIEIEAKVELYPDVKLPDYTKLKLKVQVPNTTLEEQIEDTKDKILLNQSEFKESDSAIEMQDEVIFDFSGEFQKDDGSWEAKPGMSAEDYQTIIEPGRFIENFLEQMVGMKADEEKELEVKFPDAYHDEELAGKAAKFKVKVKKASKPVKPEWSEELAKKLGEESLEALETKIKDQLEAMREDNRKHLASEAVMYELVQQSQIDLSSAMVQRELDHGLATIKEQKQMSDDEFKDFVAGLDMPKEEKLAKDKLLRGVIIATVVKDQNIEVNEEELQAELAKYNFPPDFDASQVNMPAVINKLHLDVTTNKAVDFLVESVDIEYEEVDPAELHVHGPDCSH